MKPSKLKYITIGKILSPWRTEGQLKAEVLTDFPRRFAPSSKVYIKRQPATIDDLEWRKGKAIIKLDTVNNFKEAERLRGQLIEIRESQLQVLPEGQYYHFQLVGMKVLTTQGELLGHITEILTTPNNDTYIVSGERGEILIPAAEDIVKSVDIEKKCLVIEPIKGLLDLNKKAA
ncbi:MAG: ribosome maturation factor RimM [Dehalococcoidales bacterium]